MTDDDDDDNNEDSRIESSSNDVDTVEDITPCFFDSSSVAADGGTVSVAVTPMVAAHPPSRTARTWIAAPKRVSSWLIYIMVNVHTGHAAAEIDVGG